MSEKYRADVDGLRAFAVSSVVLFHAFPNHFTGGFIGVDIFFVISGFLISRIMIFQSKLDCFSVLDFYFRRSKRILPALMFVLVGTAVIGWFVLLLDEFRQLGKHILAALGFVSNLVLWREVGYFDNRAELKPLLHLWSLGVEEQFYLFYPLFFILIWKKQKLFVYFNLSVFVLSFLLSILWSENRPTAAFFLPLTRFWELMLGSALAYFTSVRPDLLNLLRGRVYSDLFSACGVSLLIAGLILIDKNRQFPGFWAVLPTLGTALIILGGESSLLNSKVLSTKWFVYLGLISYPLYLWHWPVFVFGRLVGISASDAGSAMLIFFSIVLAVCTYHAIEIPIRRSPKGARFMISLLVSLMFFVAMIGLAMIVMVGPLHSSASIDRLVTAAGEWEYPGRLRVLHFKGHSLYQQGDAQLRSILFIGDSNAEQYYPRAELKLQENPLSFNIVFATKGGCPPIPFVIERSRTDCAQFVKNALEYAERAEVEVVVIAAQWLGYFGGKHRIPINHSNSPESISNERSAKFSDSVFIASPEYSHVIKGMQDIILRLISLGKVVYLVGNIPIGDALDPKLMIRRNIFSEHYISLNTEGVAVHDFMSTYSVVDFDLRSIAANTGAHFVSPTEFLCDQFRCPGLTPDGSVVYMNSAHLHPKFVRAHVFYLDDVFRPQRIASD